LRFENEHFTPPKKKKKKKKTNLKSWKIKKNKITLGDVYISDSTFEYNDLRVLTLTSLDDAVINNCTFTGNSDATSGAAIDIG